MPSDSPDEQGNLTCDSLRRHVQDACGKLIDRLCEYLWRRYDGGHSLAMIYSDVDDGEPGIGEVGLSRLILRH